MNRITFEVNNELYKNFKKFCVDKNCTMTFKIIELIKKELKSNQSPNLSSNHSITDKNKKI